MGAGRALCVSATGRGLSSSLIISTINNSFGRIVASDELSPLNLSYYTRKERHAFTIFQELQINKLLRYS